MKPRAGWVEDGPFSRFRLFEYAATITVIGGLDDDFSVFLDVHVEFDDGHRYTGEFITVKALEYELARVGAPPYFWTQNLVVIWAPSFHEIAAAVESLIRSGEYTTALLELPPRDEGDDGEEE